MPGVVRLYAYIAAAEAALCEGRRGISSECVASSADMTPCDAQFWRNVWLNTEPWRCVFRALCRPRRHEACKVPRRVRMGGSSGGRLFAVGKSHHCARRSGTQC
eukprot:916791-Pleurochrysis_carterae.AAC.2